MFIDAAISGRRNVMKKEAEKILKYKDVTVATQSLWSVKTSVISVIIGTVGTISG
jgi:CheY-specific phosphatase CheX